MSLAGPTMPSAASAGHESYLGISCRQWRPSVGSSLLPITDILENKSAARTWESRVPQSRVGPQQFDASTLALFTSTAVLLATFQTASEIMSSAATLDERRYY